MPTMTCSKMWKYLYIYNVEFLAKMCRLCTFYVLCDASYFSTKANTDKL